MNATQAAPGERAAQITALVDEFAHALADLRERVARLERAAADRTEPAATAAAAVVDAELCDLARAGLPG